ncbi:MAG: hypothetical protein AAFW83_14335 [Pseudomonadota bacterium]
MRSALHVLTSLIFLTVIAVSFPLRAHAVAEPDRHQPGTATAENPSSAQTGKLPKRLTNTVRVFGTSQIRYEFARQDDRTLPAHGITVGIRTGIEATIKPWLFAVVEGETVFALVDQFDDTTGNAPARPVIADPNTLKLNRAHLQARLSDETFLTVGRHRLSIDDQRFIGPAAFRQNQQTYDGVHLAKRARSGTTVQAGYFNRVNRPLGENNPNGTFRGDSYYLNTNIDTPLGRFGGFYYALDLETGPPAARNTHFSSKTIGGRFDGRWHRDTIGLDVEASYARQSDFADNPLDFATDYWLLGSRLFLDKVRLGLRAEFLGADNGEAFQTPLANRHKFQGAADLFIVTPKTGVRDLEASASYVAGRVGPFTKTNAFIALHRFNAGDGTNIRLGNEIDIGIRSVFNGVRLSAVYARYKADNFASDTQRVYLTLATQF